MMNIVNWFRERKLSKKMATALHQGIGQYSAIWQATDPEAENKYLNWLEARRRMARRPIETTFVQLRLISISSTALQRIKQTGKPDSIIIEEQGINFPWDEYPDLHDTFVEMFRKAIAVPDTEEIRGLLVDTGDLVEHSFRDVERQLAKRNR